MPTLKRKGRQLDEDEATNFVQLLCNQALRRGAPSETLQLLWDLKAEVAQQSNTKSASSYTRIAQVAEDFQLDFEENDCVWSVASLVEGRSFQPSPCLGWLPFILLVLRFEILCAGSFINELDRNLLRTSEANCRVLVSLILSEVLSHLVSPCRLTLTFHIYHFAERS
jgi:hypothetical protein